MTSIHSRTPATFWIPHFHFATGVTSQPVGPQDVSLRGKKRADHAIPGDGPQKLTPKLGCSSLPIMYHPVEMLEICTEGERWPDGRLTSPAFGHVGLLRRSGRRISRPDLQGSRAAAPSPICVTPKTWPPLSRNLFAFAAL